MLKLIIRKKLEILAQQLKSKVLQIKADERGDIGIKSIAMMVATIVIIGVAIGIISGNMSGWISQLWEMFIGFINDFFKA